MKAWKPAAIVIALTLAGSGCSTIVRSSVSSNGTAANAPSSIGPRLISDNGRYVAFTSDASNLVPDDTNNASDVFRRDNVTGTTIRVSVANSGSQIPRGTGFGMIAYAISGDGQHIAFRTDVALEPEDTNSMSDVYVRSVASGTTERVSIRPDGTPILLGTVDGLEGIKDVTISDDGRFVLVLDTRPTSIRPPLLSGTAYLRDRVTDSTTVQAEFAKNALLSGDGTHIVKTDLCMSIVCPPRSTVYPIGGATSDEIDIECLLDLFDVSADARFVVAYRWASANPKCAEPGGLLRWDRTTKTFRKIPIEVLPTNVPSVTIANRGRIVAALGLDGVVRVADLATGVTQVVDTDALGLNGSGSTTGAAISGNGRYVAFDSSSPALVPEDTNEISDVFTKYSLKPEVSTVRPAVARGTRAVVSVHGFAFFSPAGVSIAGPGVTVHSVTVVNARTLAIDVSVAADAAPGTRAVVVRNGGGFGHADDHCTACFTIT